MDITSSSGEVEKSTLWNVGVVAISEFSVQQVTSGLEYCHRIHSKCLYMHVASLISIKTKTISLHEIF